MAIYFQEYFTLLNLKFIIIQAFVSWASLYWSAFNRLCYSNKLPSISMAHNKKVLFLTHVNVHCSSSPYAHHLNIQVERASSISHKLLVYLLRNVIYYTFTFHWQKEFTWPSLMSVRWEIKFSCRSSPCRKMK